MQFFDIAIPPTGVERRSVKGRYIYFLEGSAGGADTTIAVRKGAGGQTVLLKPGQAARIEQDSEHDTDWLISNYKGQGTVIGFVLIGDGEFFDNRISGSVEVVDGGKYRTMAGTSFWGSTYSGVVAGQYSASQLWNPPGSGRRLVVEQVGVGMFTSSGAISIAVTAAPLLSSIRNGKNKMAGGAQSVGQMRYESSAGGFIPAADSMADVYTVEKQIETLRLSEPVVLMPGYGLTAQSPIGGGCTANFEFYEESATA